MDRLRTLYERVERLTPGERRKLQGRLKDLRPAGPSAVSSQDGPAPLVAFVTLKDGNGESAQVEAELRRLCTSELPEYQRPTRIVFLDQLPTLPNGKIDRLSLRSHSFRIDNKSNTAVVIESPRHDVDALLVSIWEDVLQIDDVGIRDNFFELGGDSIISIQITSRLRQHGHMVPPTAIAAHPTIAQLADELLASDRAKADDGAEDTGGFDPLVLMKPGDSKPPVFCLHASGGDPIIFSEFARHYPSSRPVYGVRATAVSGLPAMSSIPEMAKLYVDHMMRLVADGEPFHLFTECVGGPLILETAHELDKRGARVGSILILDPGWIHPERSDWYSQAGSNGAIRSKASRISKFLSEPQKLRKIFNYGREKYRKISSRLRDRVYVQNLSEYHRLAVKSFTIAADNYAPARSPRGIDLLVTADWQHGNRSWPARLTRWNIVADQKTTVHEVPGGHVRVLDGKHTQELGQIVENIVAERE